MLRTSLLYSLNEIYQVVKSTPIFLSDFFIFLSFVSKSWSNLLEVLSSSVLPPTSSFSGYFLPDNLDEFRLAEFFLDLCCVAVLRAEYVSEPDSLLCSSRLSTRGTRWPPFVSYFSISSTLFSSFSTIDTNSLLRPA